MHVVSLLAAAESHARATSSAVILLKVSIHDGEAISRLPSAIPPAVCSDLFVGPQMLGFDHRSQAVDAFNEIVRDLVVSRFECAYTITLTDGDGDPVVESNIDGVGMASGRHAFAILSGGDLMGLERPTSAYSETGIAA